MSMQITAWNLKLDEHIHNIFSDGELAPESVIRKFRITADDGKSYNMHAGKISHVQALTKAKLECEKHRTMQINLPSLVETDFENAIKQLPKPGPKKGDKS